MGGGVRSTSGYTETRPQGGQWFTSGCAEILSSEGPEFTSGYDEALLLTCGVTMEQGYKGRITVPWVLHISGPQVVLVVYQCR